MTKREEFFDISNYTQVFIKLYIKENVLNKMIKIGQMIIVHYY